MTWKTRSSLQTDYADNTTGLIDADNGRDVIESVMMRRVREISTTPVTLDDDDFIVLADATAAAITINLPAVASAPHAVYCIKKVDVSVNAVTIDASSTEIIETAETYVLDDQYDTVWIAAGSAKWHILSRIAAD